MQNFLRGDAQLVATFTEIESGKKNERPQLAAAIARARQEGAVLLVAKLDRLARNVAFLATLMESHVRFQAVDLPAADEFTLHIMAAVAQKEASAISPAPARRWQPRRPGVPASAPRLISPKPPAKSPGPR